jgi:predicted amidohydrolase YtcJ
MRTSNSTLAAAIMLLLFLGAACTPSGKDASEADGKDTTTAGATVYFNGDIITMEGDSPEYVEALVERDGKIAFLGTKAEALSAAGEGARMVDLMGQTLTPGFVDAHGHMIYMSKNAIDADLSGCKDVAEVIERLKAHAKDVPEGGWIVGFGYRAVALKEGRHPTAVELDQVSTTIPVYAKDGSGHHGSINTSLMRTLGLNASTPDPEGGFYERTPGSSELLGHVAEEAHFHVGANRPSATPEMIERGLAEAVRIWVENGHTTAQETGLGLGADDFETVKYAIEKKVLPIDLVVFVKGAVVDKATQAAYDVKQRYDTLRTDDLKMLLDERPDMNKRYYNRIRLGGLKYWMDGSNETALMSKPFTKLPAGVTDKNYKGIQTTSTTELEAAFDKYWKSDIQIAIHVIGDQAIEVCLQAIEKTVKKQGDHDHRPIFQHAQLTRPDQIPRIKAVGGIASFTMAGLEVMGDAVAPLFGEERLPWAIPANSMQKAGIRWTSHTDWPAGGSPSELVGMNAAVNRRTSSGNVIVPEERVTPYQALRAITINAAYQLKEENAKGSLKVGKLADLVILDSNPLKVDPATIKQVRVMRTIKEGRTVYAREQDAPVSAAVGIKEHSHALHEQVSASEPSPADRKTILMLMRGSN